MQQVQAAALHAALRPQGIAQVVKLHAQKTGYDPADFSGHSLRSGFLTSPADRGASVEIFEDHPADGVL